MIEKRHFGGPRPAFSPSKTPIRQRFSNLRMPLSLTEWPHPGAPIAILVHGNRDHSRSWDAIACALQANYHVFAPDLRGHGDSAWSPDGRYEHAAYLSDLDALCTMLNVSEARPVTLVGHSLGAHIALRFAGAHPGHIEKLIAIEPVGAPIDIETLQRAMPLHERIHRWLDDRRRAAALSPRAFASVGEAADRMLAQHSYLTRKQAMHLARYGTRRRNGALRWKYDPLVTVWPFPELDVVEMEALWQRVTCPTLAIFGERSWPSTLPARLIASMDNVRDVRLPNSGHWPQHDALDDCLDAIRRFLDFD